MDSRPGSRLVTQLGNIGNNYLDVLTGVCGGTRYLGKSGTAVIRSPDYPGHYRKNVDCEWVVRGPAGNANFEGFIQILANYLFLTKPGHYLSLTFAELDLPRMANCTGTDYVQIKVFRQNNWQKK